MSDGPMEGHRRQWESTVGSKRAQHTHTHRHTHTDQKKKQESDIIEDRSRERQVWPVVPNVERAPVS